MVPELVDAFHTWYYERRAETWERATWCGVPILKNPCDLWIIQELIARLRPAWIVETGTHRGGSALYYAMLCDRLAAGHVLSVDHDPQPPRPVHRRIAYLHGDSAAASTLKAVRRRVLGHPTLVLLDSDHSAAHVLAELRAYSPLVTPGSYLVVEDTNLNGHPVAPDWGPGPAEGLAQWLAEDSPPFDADGDCERLGMTWSPGGWLRRREA